MKQRIVLAVLFVLVLIGSASAAELDIRVTFNDGMPVTGYIAQNATIAVYEWRPMVPSWTDSPWEQQLVGEFKCPKEDTSGMAPQGCLGQYGQTTIYQRPNGMPLGEDRFFLVKVNAQGFRQAKAEWVFVPAGSYGIIDLELQRLPVEVYSSYSTWYGVTTVWHWMYNNTSQPQRLRLDTTLKAAGVTSKDNEFRGSTIFVNLAANSYTVYSERWVMPTAGQTYGENNCVRAQITPRSGSVAEAVTCIPNSVR
jgi:hypothetical protein